MKRLSIKNILATAAAASLGFVAQPAAAGTSGESLLKVTHVKVACHDNELSLALEMDPRALDPGRDREVVFTPVLRSLTSADSIEMPTIRVAGRNRYYSHIRNNDIDYGQKLTLAGSREPLVYRQEMALEPWMTHSRIVMREEVGNCCDAPVPLTTTPVAELDLEVRPVELPFEYVALVGDSIITRKAEGRAFVNFVVNRTELKPDYMKNPEEIGKILASIDLVKSDPEAIITRITIKGYASPEGSYTNNVRLAMGRTQTLKEYVRQQFNFDPSIMATDFEPEDWQGLRDWLVENEIENRDAILGIVDSSMEPDPKNSEIQKRFPAQYAQLLRDVYPWLRHSDYTINYTFRIHTDLDELKRIFAESPDRLRPVDFQRIAASYEPGTDEFNEVYMTAVRIHPNDELANLNAANISMAAGNLAAASKYLLKSGSTPEALYTRGVLAARQRDFNMARLYLDQARNMGFEKASEALLTLDAEQNRRQITYLIKGAND